MRNARRLAIAIALVLGLFAARDSGHASAQTPTFEVASIKPNLSGTNMVNFGWAGGRFTAENASLRMLISLAFADGAPWPQNRIVINEQWIGGASFASSEHFDIVAKAEGDPQREQLPPYLRALLTERFKLVIHREQRSLPIYVLRLDRADGKLGNGLRRSAIDCEKNPPTQPPPASPPAAASSGFAPTGCGFRSVPGRAAARGVSIKSLARLMTSWIDDHRPVEDETGLDGPFDIDLEWSTDRPLPPDAPALPPPNPNAPSLFTALREQLGLKAEAGRQSEEILVVDHAERPTPD